MTALYTFRAIFLTFEGEYKGGEAPPSTVAARRTTHGAQPHESPPVMALPLLILAVPAALAGFVNFPNNATEGLAHLLEGGAAGVFGGVATATRRFNFGLAALSTLLALAGARRRRTLIYQARIFSVANSAAEDLRPLHTLARHKYYMDELYEDF